MRYLIVFTSLLIASTAGAHITPPRVLLQESDAVRSLLPAAQTISRADLRPTEEQRQAVKQIAGWTPDQRNYKAFLGRDAQGREVGTVVFIGEITVHGLVQMAVGLAPGGAVTGANVVTITDEAYGWVKPLVDADFTAQFKGKRAADQYIEGPRVAARRGSMETFYGQVLASLIQRSAVLYDVGRRSA